MKECKVIALEGKTLADYEEEINRKLRGGWRLIGNFGKNNMLCVFDRSIKIAYDEEEDD